MSTLTVTQTAQELLDRFSLKIDEIPVVICSGNPFCAIPLRSSWLNVWDSRGQSMSRAFVMLPSWVVVRRVWRPQFTPLLKA